jgi:hypothetical protein
MSLLVGNNKLTKLILGFNQMEGQLPPQLMYLSHLVTLDVSYNHFNGEIPVEIYTMMQSIAAIDLSYNNFTGSISEALAGNFFRISFLIELLSN